MRFPIFLLIAGFVFSSCAPEYQIRSSTSVSADPVVTCIPEEGRTVPAVDTLCVEGSERCYKIRPVEGGMHSGEDDFGLAAASDVSIDRAEIFCFTSTRPTDGKIVSSPSQNIWIATRARDGRISPPAPLTANQLVIMEGSPSLSPDGQTVYFAAKNRPDSVGDCDIYQARLERSGDGFRLTGTTPIPVINSPSFDSHPSISPDGLTLYFTSDRPGGRGNSDIWFSIRDRAGTWSAPRNLGPPVNTSCNEMTPFICGDNQTLYFCSDGFNTLGGFDLFTAVRSDDGAWSRPVNLGAPVNTPADELFPSTPPSVRADSIFYFSSNRAGGRGGYDLYAVTPNPQAPHMITLRGTVRGMRTREPVTEARLFWKDLSTGELVATVLSNNRGEFFVALTKGRKYDVGAQAEKYFHDTYVIETPRTPGVREFEHDFFLAETLSLRINFPFDDFRNPYPFVLDDDGNPTNTTWEQALEFVALNLASYRDRIERVILTGHTDPLGDDEYNRALSGRRAAFVRDQLVAGHGIPASLIEIAARGKSTLLGRRPGEADEPYYTRCRRVELTKVVRREGGVR